MSLYDILQESGAERGGKVSGVTIGIVTNNQDPDGLARVKIKLPWRGSNDESHWARVATLMTGNQTGTDRLREFIPRANEELRRFGGISRSNNQTF